MNRKHDIYLFACSHNHMVAPPGKFLAFASTIVEGPTDGVSPKVRPAEAMESRVGPRASRLRTPKRSSHLRPNNRAPRWFLSV